MGFSRYMVVCIDGQPVEKTMLAKVAQSLLLIKGCDASFVIARLENKEKSQRYLLEVPGHTMSKRLWKN